MKRFKPLSLLVVEDNPGDYLLLEKFLKVSQLPLNKISHADNMAAVSVLAKNNGFDVALLDLSLPDSSGIDSVITLDRLLPEIPIVVFSGLTDISIAVESISLGAQDYLVKGEFNEKLLAKSVQYSIERKKTLEKLRISNEKYELVNRATFDTIWEWDYQTGKGLWGEGFMKTFGYSEEKLKYDENWQDEFIHPDDKEQVIKKIKHCIASLKENWQDEYRFRCADGSYKYVYDRGFILFNEKGQPFRMFGAMTDITERKKLELELAEQRVKQQKLITEVTIQAQEKERNELGRELHDNINQILATIKMYMGMAKEKKEVPKDVIVSCYGYVTEAMEEIRKLSHSLVTPSLGDIGLKDALYELAEEINNTNKLKVELAYKTQTEKNIDKQMELMIYRIIQEQVNNILKHSQASKALISLIIDESSLVLNVTDNGMGFDTSQTAKGIGLRNIHSRVEFYSGKMNIISAPGKGCALEISIPY